MVRRNESALRDLLATSSTFLVLEKLVLGLNLTAVAGSAGLKMLGS